jgi:hypothetical protein
MTIVVASVWGVIRSLALAVVVATLCGCGSSNDKTSSATSAPAPAATTSNGAPVIDGISCQPEHLETHYHAHLAMLRNGTPVKVPAFIGIDFNHQCLYWLHTHDATGIMHIESPDTRKYTLGNWFDVWGKPLSATRAASLTGKLRFYVGNKQVSGDPRKIVLSPHELITIEQGKKVPPAPFQFPPGL